MVLNITQMHPSHRCKAGKTYFGGGVGWGCVWRQTTHLLNTGHTEA